MEEGQHLREKERMQKKKKYIERDRRGQEGRRRQ